MIATQPSAVNSAYAIVHGLTPLRPRNHHANTCFSAKPLGRSPKRPASKPNAASPSPTKRSASASPCARLAAPVYEAARPWPSAAWINFSIRPRNPSPPKYQPRRIRFHSSSSAFRPALIRLNGCPLYGQARELGRLIT